MDPIVLFVVKRECKDPWIYFEKCEEKKEKSCVIADGSLLMWLGFYTITFNQEVKWPVIQLIYKKYILTILKSITRQLQINLQQIHSITAHIHYVCNIYRRSMISKAIKFQHTLLLNKK